MHKSLQSSCKLLYIIQLHLDGLKDAGTSMLHSELIQRLLCHRKAWLSLTSSEEIGYVPLRMNHICRAYELVGGAFAHTDKQHLEIVWLPTFSGGETCTLQRASIEAPIRQFAMDPTQDLIMLLEDDAT